MKCLKPFAVLLVSAILSACAMYRASDFPLTVQLPGSKECVDLYVMSGREVRYSQADCEKKIQRSVHLSSEAWKLVRSDIQANCQLANCAQIQGAADGLFLSLDQALQKTPLP